MCNDGTAPTVVISVEKWEERSGGLWVWEPMGDAFPDMPDYLFSADEVARALYVCGAAVARLWRGTRFRLVARRVQSGGVVGLHEWRLSADLGRLAPTHAPWAEWPEVVRSKRTA